MIYGSVVEEMTLVGKNVYINVDWCFLFLSNGICDISRTKYNDKIINKSNRSLINNIYYDVEQWANL